MVISGRDYYWARAQGLEKLFGEAKASEMTKEESKVDDAGKEKLEKSTATTTVPAYPDYAEYVVCVDVRQYHLVYNHLTDMRNNYLKAHVLFARNMKKLKDPRGDGDGK